MAMIACGSTFWVAVTERGGLVVHGENDQGQVDIGTRVQTPRPTALSGLGPVAGDAAAELAGGMEALALHAGDAPEAPAAALAHPFVEKVTMVAVGEEHSVCVTDDGAVWAWGANHRGQLGITHTQTPQQLACGVHLTHTVVPLQWGADLCNGAPARMVACGDHHTLVLTRTGEVWACGDGAYGETGSAQAVRTPERVTGLPAGVVLVAANANFSGAVGADGQVWMWGACRWNQLGFPVVQPHLHRNPVPTGLGLAAFGGEPVVQLSLGTHHSTAVTNTGALWVWGQNDHGGLGLGDTANRAIPTLVAAGGAPVWGGSRVLMAASGCYHQLVLTEDGAVWTCGEGEYGLLGNGDERDTWVPARIAPAFFGGARIVFVATGCAGAFAVTAEGILYVWGIHWLFRNNYPVQTTPTPLAASLAPGLRIGRSSLIPRWHALVFCMGMHARVGAQAALRVLGTDTAQKVLADSVRLDGDLAHMGEGLLRQLAVCARQN